MELPKRKHIRLKEYDYSQSGYYYITINTKDNLPILSSVGRGLAPADINVILSPIGIIAEQQLFELEKRYNYLKIYKYVIMPTHIHLILVLSDEEHQCRAGARSRQIIRPTLTDIICTYKSLTTRICNKNDNIQGRVIFQTSFFEKIIRNETGYKEAWKYIDQNPAKWQEDRYFSEL